MRAVQRSSPKQQEFGDSEVRALKNKVIDLQRKLQNAESPDQRLIRTCESLRQDRERLEEEVNTLKRKNLELSEQVGESRTICEKNDQLKRALVESTAREQKLSGKYQRVATKFKEIKKSVGSLGEKYKKLIQDKQDGDRERIELMNKQIRDNEEKEQLKQEIQAGQRQLQEAATEIQAMQTQLQKHKESLVRVMKHYQDAKVRKKRAEDRVKEICKINDTNIEQLKGCMEALQKKNAETEQLQIRIAELEELHGKEIQFEDKSKSIEIDNLEQENMKLRQELQALRQQASFKGEEDESLLPTLREQNENLVKQLLKVQSDCRQLREELEETQQRQGKPSGFDVSEITEMKRKNSKLENENRKLSEENKNLKQKCATLEDTLQQEPPQQPPQEDESLLPTLREQNENLVKQLLKVQSDCRQLREELEETQQKQPQTTDFTRKLTEENEKLKQTCADLEAENEDLQQRFETVLNEFATSVEVESESDKRKTSALETMAQELNDLRDTNRELMEMLITTQNQLTKEKLSHNDSDLQTKLDELRKENRELRQEVNAVKDTDYDTIVEELAELRDQNRQLLQQLEEVHEENESLQAVSADELNSSIEENKELRSSVKALKRENRRLKNSTDNEAYRLENEDLRAKLEELQNEVAQERRKAADMIDDTAFAAMVDQLEGLRSRNRELEAMIDKYRQGVGETGVSAILAELNEMREKVETLEKENNELRSENAFSRERVFISSDDEIIDSLSSKKEVQLQKEISVLKRENASLREQIEASDGDLVTTLSILSEKKEKELEAEIKALKSGNDEGYRKLLEQQMKVIVENEELRRTCDALQRQVLALRNGMKPVNVFEDDSKPEEDDIDQEIMEDVERMEKSSSIKVKLDDRTTSSDGAIEEESVNDEAEKWYDVSVEGSEEGEVIDERNREEYVRLESDGSGAKVGTYLDTDEVVLAGRASVFDDSFGAA